MLNIHSDTTEFTPRVNSGKGGEPVGKGTKEAKENIGQKKLPGLEEKHYDSALTHETENIRRAENIRSAHFGENTEISRLLEINSENVESAGDSNHRKSVEKGFPKEKEQVLQRAWTVRPDENQCEEEPRRRRGNLAANESAIRRARHMATTPGHRNLSGFFLIVLKFPA
jgi:hypothetical protein